ncbi:MAG: hypothetical protein IRZ32_00005 [Solirubrobacteraceae bacterium]|nr:hypothetical protein [Solirubrobacteraceae bacterium]
MRFPAFGRHEAAVHRLDELGAGAVVAGPAIVESPFTTVVVEPGGSVERAPSGSLLLRPAASATDEPTRSTGAAHHA